MLLRALATERKCRWQNVLILYKVESYRRTNVDKAGGWKTIWLGMEFGRFYKKEWGEALRKGTGCFSRKTVWGQRARGMCVLESQVLFAVSTSSVCLYYKRSDSLYTNMSAFWHRVKYEFLPVFAKHTEGEKANRTTSYQIKKETWTILIKASQPPMKLIRLQDIREHVQHQTFSQAILKQIRWRFIFCKNKSVHHHQHSQRCPCCPWKMLKQKTLLIRCLTSNDSAKFIKVTSQESTITFEIMQCKKPYHRCHRWLATMGCSVGGNPGWCSRIDHEDRLRCLHRGRSRGQRCIIS